MSVNKDDGSTPSSLNPVSIWQNVTELKVRIRIYHLYQRTSLHRHPRTRKMWDFMGAVGLQKNKYVIVCLILPCFDRNR